MLDTKEKLPLVRFVKTAEEDRIATEIMEEATGKPGMTQYMDVVKVYIRAAGDMKTEVVDIAEKTAYDITEAKVKVEKPHTVFKEVDGEMQEVEEKAVVEEIKQYRTPKIVRPWLDKQKERLHHKKITQNYYDYCVKSFERFKNNEDQPIEGTPLAMWPGAPEKVKKRAIECGIRSVEAAADMTSEAMGAIGMGASDLKKAAKAYITNTNQTEEQLQQVSEENKALQEQMGALEAKLAELSKPKPKTKKESAAA